MVWRSRYWIFSNLQIPTSGNSDTYIFCDTPKCLGYFLNRGNSWI
jgi:hypothetical protein